MNLSKTCETKHTWMIAAFAALIIMALLIFDTRAFADEIAEGAPAAEETADVNTVADSDNDGVSDDVERQIAAQEKAAADAKAQADAQIAAQQKAAEEARLKAEAEVEAQKKAVEEQKARVEAEKKAKEEEIARKKAEEEAKKQAEEMQRRFEESLTASGMSDEDFNALCKIVQAEDGHDSIEGRIGIANVILNRVRSPFYPNTIMGVLTAPGQFGPVRNGAFAAAVPSASTISAVKEAIAGRNTVGNALYFHRGGSFGGKTLVAVAGAHSFFA